MKIVSPKSLIKLKKTNRFIRRDVFLGARSISNYIFRTGSFFFGLRFIVVGLSSAIKKEIFDFNITKEVVFFPQGMVITFYGIGFFILRVYFFLRVFTDTGSGFNEYDKKKKKVVRIFRKGFQ